MLSSLFYIQGDEACLPFELFLPDLFLPKQPFLIIKQKKQNSQLFLKPLSACDKVQVQNPPEADQDGRWAAAHPREHSAGKILGREGWHILWSQQG